MLFVSWQQDIISTNVSHKGRYEWAIVRHLMRDFWCLLNKYKSFVCVCLNMLVILYDSPGLYDAVSLAVCNSFVSKLWYALWGCNFCNSLCELICGCAFYVDCMIPLQSEIVVDNNPSKGVNTKEQVMRCIVYFLPLCLTFGILLTVDFCCIRFFLIQMRKRLLAMHVALPL